MRRYLLNHISRAKAAAKRQSPPNPTPGPTTLGGLIPELLFSITDFLPVVDRICLSLCSRRLLAVFRKQIHRWNLSCSSKEKLSILNRLERDLPEYIACDVCKILHHYDGSEPFEPFGIQERSFPNHSPFPCIRDYSWFKRDLRMKAHYWLKSPFHHQLIFFYIKLVMRGFYYGPKAGISPDCLSYLKVKDFSKNRPRDDVIWLFSQDAQICDSPPGLYIRLQDVLLVRRREDSLVDPNEIFCLDLPITAHADVCLHKRSFNTIFPRVRSFHEKQQKYIAHDITCKICNTEAHVEITEMGSKIALIVTKWINLGPGITPDDILWRAHVDDPFQKPESIPEHLYTNPRLCFEGASLLPFKDLGSRNLSILQNREYLTSSSFRLWPWIIKDEWIMPFQAKEHGEVANVSERRNLLRFLPRWAVLSEKNRDRLRRAGEVISFLMDANEGGEGSASLYV